MRYRTGCRGRLVFPDTDPNRDTHPAAWIPPMTRFTRLHQSAYIPEATTIFPRSVATVSAAGNRGHAESHSVAGQSHRPLDHSYRITSVRDGKIAEDRGSNPRGTMGVSPLAREARETTGGYHRYAPAGPNGLVAYNSSLSRTRRGFKSRFGRRAARMNRRPHRPIRHHQSASLHHSVRTDTGRRRPVPPCLLAGSTPARGMGVADSPTN